jgi:hypothetical protein
MTKASIELHPKNLASIFRGLYVRVAARLGVDPSYVSRVARGERQSDAVEAALERETHQIIKNLKMNHNGFKIRSAGRNSSGRNGTNRRGAKSSRSSQS